MASNVRISQRPKEWGIDRTEKISWLRKSLSWNVIGCLAWIGKQYLIPSIQMSTGLCVWNLGFNVQCLDNCSCHFCWRDPLGGCWALLLPHQLRHRFCCIASHLQWGMAWKRIFHNMKLGLACMTKRLVIFRWKSALTIAAWRGKSFAVPLAVQRLAKLKPGLNVCDINSQTSSNSDWTSTKWMVYKYCAA